MGTGLNFTKTKLHKVIYMQEGTKLHKNKIAQSQICTRAQNCTREQNCKKTILHQGSILQESKKIQKKKLLTEGKG